MHLQFKILNVDWKDIRDWFLGDTPAIGGYTRETDPLDAFLMLCLDEFWSILVQYTTFWLKCPYYIQTNPQVNQQIKLISKYTNALIIIIQSTHIL